MKPAARRFQILGAALLFSTGGAAIKASVLTNWQVACFRSGVAALVLLLCVPSWRHLLRPRRLLVGVAYAATMILFVSANKLTTAANTIFLQATAPIYVLLLGPRLLHEPVRRADLAFIAALAVGLTLFFAGAEPAQATAPNPVLGNTLGLLAGLSWALTILGLRWLGRDADGAGGDATGSAVVSGNLLACLACLPLAFPLDAARGIDWAIVGYLGTFQIGLAYVWMTRGVRHVPALETSLLLLLEPVLSTVWAWWIHDERSGPAALAGCTVILLATLAHALRRRG